MLPQVERPGVLERVVTSLQAVLKFLGPFEKPEKWQPLVYQTGWVDSAFGFVNGAVRKDALGRVHLRGLPVRTSGASAVICNLPVGYRPTAAVLCTTSSNNAYARVDIAKGGDVTVVVGSPGIWVSIDNISFDTEA